jgi:hypothetical protein
LKLILRFLSLAPLLSNIHTFGSRGFVTKLYFPRFM